MSGPVPSAKLKKLVRLSQRKDALLAQIQDLDREMRKMEQELRKSPGHKVPKGKITFSNAPGKQRRARPSVRKRAKTIH